MQWLQINAARKRQANKTRTDGARRWNAWNAARPHSSILLLLSHVSLTSYGRIDGRRGIPEPRDTGVIRLKIGEVGGRAHVWGKRYVHAMRWADATVEQVDGIGGG